jgi:hypothetical protein
LIEEVPSFMLTPQKIDKLHAVYESQLITLEQILSNYTDEELNIINDYYSKKLIIPYIKKTLDLGWFLD